jgi:RNA polymerase sigma-70 factor (ECF subfamily)
MSSAAAARIGDDGALLARIANGEMQALGQLYDRHREAVLRFAARAGSRADAEDVTHATFLKVAQIAATYDGRVSARPWLFGIVANVLYQRRRGAARFARMLSSFAWWSGRSSSDPRDALHARSELSDVERALAGLSDAKRVVLVMAEIEEISTDEIAKALSIPIGTVWTRLHSARRDLRKVLEGGDQ